MAIIPVGYLQAHQTIVTPDGPRVVREITSQGDGRLAILFEDSEEPWVTNFHEEVDCPEATALQRMRYYD